MFNHLNELHTIFNQLTTQDVKFSYFVEAMYMLVTLPKNWDTFWIAISNSSPASNLASTNVESSLLTREVNRKNLDSIHVGNALYARGQEHNA